MVRRVAQSLLRVAPTAAWGQSAPRADDAARQPLPGLLARAIARDPARVEGWDHAAAGMGKYALGLGLFRALRQGIEGKFKDRLSHAERIDPGYQGGAIQTAWERFWFELPWPRYDAGRSEQALRAALARDPDNVRAHVYLAEPYRKERRGDDAAVDLGLALAHAPGRYDAPEERRYQAVARELIDEW